MKTAASGRPFSRAALHGTSLARRIGHLRSTSMADVSKHAASTSVEGARIVGEGKDGASPGPYVLSCDTFLGDDVVNARGEALGKIAHVVLDVSQGKVAYAVLAYGGVFGIGEKLFAVPWSALVLDAERRCFVLDIPKERLDDWEGGERLQ